MDHAAIGSHIHALRNKQKITLEELAEHIGISASFLGNIERGTRIASLDTMVAICNALAVSPEYLLCDSLRISPTAMMSSISKNDVARLRRQLQCAMAIVNRLSD